MHVIFSGRAKYVCQHTSALPFLRTNHNRSLPAEQGLTPHSHHTMNKCTLIIPYVMPLEVFYQTQIIILPCIYVWLFPWQPTLCSILPLFLYLGGSTGSGYHLYGETLSVFSFTNGHCQQHPWIGHMVGGIPDHNDGSICWQLKTQ